MPNPSRRGVLASVLGLWACRPTSDSSGESGLPITGAGGTSGRPDTAFVQGTTTVALAIADYPALASPGGQAYVQEAVGALIVACVADGQYVCLSSVCTHAGCTVQYEASGHRLACPCHGSIFSDTGRVEAGPAPRPLKSYLATWDAANAQVLLSL